MIINHFFFIATKRNDDKVNIISYYTSLPSNPDVNSMLTIGAVKDTLNNKALVDHSHRVSEITELNKLTVEVDSPTTNLLFNAIN